jgi:DNA-binding LytR/AlgR family response regulator
MLFDTPQNVINLLDTGMRRGEIPVKKIKSFKYIDAVIKVMDDIAAYDAVFFSPGKIRKADVELAIQLRVKHPSLYIIFILTDTADVSEVARPVIRISGVLFVPLQLARLYKMVWEIYDDFTRSINSGVPRFMIKNGSEQVFIDIEDIYFLEARAGKMVLKTHAQEISFYATFEAVMTQLPDWFIRCDRGIVVNTRYVKNASWSDMLLYLKDGSQIPVSRRNKKAVAEKLTLNGGNRLK